MKRLLLAGCAFGVLATPSAGAWAQSAAPAAHSQLEQVIVTASRRKENLQRTAIAITAVSASRLQAAGVTTIGDLGKTVAGLSITNTGAGSQIYLRGVGTFSTDAYPTSPVATNLDAIYLGLSAFSANIFYDIARVEVLKGPQGTLYGKNATAGAINIITNQPGATTNGYASVEIGNYGLYKTEVAVNIAVNNQLSIRGAAQFLDRNGYTTDNVGRTIGESLRLTALYKPTPDISLTLGTDYEHTSGQEDPSLILGANPHNPWQGPTTAQSNALLLAARNPADPFGVGLPAFFSSVLPTLNSSDFTLRNDNFGIREDLEWNLGGANLAVISSYRHLASYWVADPGFYDLQSGIAHQESVELRLSSPADSQRLKWQTGLYYYGNSDKQYFDSNQGFSQGFNHITDGDKSAAAFGEFTYSVVPHLRLTGGIRGTVETADQSGIGEDVTTPAAIANFANFLETVQHVPSFVAPGIAAHTFPPLFYNETNSLNSRNISLKAGAEYDAAPNSLLYANFTTGFKSGGLNQDLNTAASPNTYKPETLEAYSLGSKNRFLDGTLQANLEAFYWDYRNHQEIYLTPTTASPSSSIPETHNVGASTLKGVNADLQYRLTTDDLLGAQIEYLDATFNHFVYTEYTTPGITPGTGCATSVLGETVLGGQTQAINRINCSGKPFTRAPHWSINASLQHTFELGGNSGDIVALVTTEFKTGEYLATDYIPQEHENSYTRTDINLTYEPPSGKWSLTAYVRNIENAAVYANAFEYAFAKNVVLAIPNAPRTFGGIFKVHF